MVLFFISNINIYIFRTYTIYRTAELKKKLFGHAPSVFRRASKSLLNLVIYIKKKHATNGLW